MNTPERHRFAPYTVLTGRETQQEYNRRTIHEATEYEGLPTGYEDGSITDDELAGAYEADDADLLSATEDELDELVERMTLATERHAIKSRQSRQGRSEWIRYACGPYNIGNLPPGQSVRP